MVLGPFARARSKCPGLPNNSKVAGLSTFSTWLFAVLPRSGGLMVIESFLEGRDRGGGPPLRQTEVRRGPEHSSAREPWPGVNALKEAETPLLH